MHLGLDLIELSYPEPVMLQSRKDLPGTEVIIKMFMLNVNNL